MVGQHATKPEVIIHPQRENGGVRPMKPLREGMKTAHVR